jgi:hypothetical protein
MRSDGKNVQAIAMPTTRLEPGTLAFVVRCVIHYASDDHILRCVKLIL